jgi:hypothetical protein
MVNNDLNKNMIVDYNEKTLHISRTIILIYFIVDSFYDAILHYLHSKIFNIVKYFLID